MLLHQCPRALLQLNCQTVSSPSTTFTAALSTDPLLSAGAGGDKKGKGKARGTGAGAAEKAARINAAVMGLVDTGVQLRGMLVAVAVAVVPVAGSDEEEDLVHLDPPPEEELALMSTHVAAG
ncbi:hypothetical protein DMC30DRAFT_413812 [Rhodotorula diobovata]|uniref:Uncharacterized protein n=1 Tax=Rhodotorula diobovata TaxID=5288 RepID=A0A5C5G426_9BASI|nr:hypothetical protein DMC30DRAFT_413812 [Rhodotorula diobovata]